MPEFAQGENRMASQKTNTARKEQTVEKGLIISSESYLPKVYSGPSKEEVLAKRKQYVNPAVFTYYKEPLMIVDGHMQYLFDENGKRYLDLFAGIVTVSCGHSHPKIIARTKAQIDKLQHTTTIYLNPGLGELAEKLASTLPGDLGVTYFVNSGSEANDLAITMARLYTGNFDLLALKNCYHGATSSMMGVTSHHTWKYPLPQGDGVHHVALPDPYRSALGKDQSAIIEGATKDLRDTILYATPGKVAGFIAEPIQGVGGATSGPKEYYQRAQEITKEFGGLYISDEVQTGFGRTGEHYWGFQNFDLTPDIVVMAKGIGNGAPLAAVTTTPEIAKTLSQRIHFNTFGGNPVSVAQGLATLEVIEEEGLQENARLVGGYFKEQLSRLQRKHKLIGDVRGQGLMLGIELVSDRSSKEPASAETAVVFEEAKNRGVLLGKGGLFGNVLRIKPPLCITKANVDQAIEVLDQCLKLAAPKQSRGWGMFRSGRKKPQASA